MSITTYIKAFSTHEQIVFKLSAKLIAASFAVGLVWVFSGFSDQSPGADNKWTESSVPAAADTLGLYISVTERPRWFTENPVQITKPVAEDPAKALEGKPESLRLTGLVTKGDTRYALFVPLIPSASATGNPAVLQLKEGDKLVGEWEITSISANQVQVRQGEETRVLKMYQPKK